MRMPDIKNNAHRRVLEALRSGFQVWAPARAKRAYIVPTQELLDAGVSVAYVRVATLNEMTALKLLEEELNYAMNAGNEDRNWKLVKSTPAE